MGIAGFFYYLKNKYKKSFTVVCNRKYDYLVLDYHSLFHNIKNLYDEINYMIRLLFEAKYQYENNIDYFYTNRDTYHILTYIITTYNNLFKLIGINNKNIKFTLGKKEHTLKKINFILNKFPLSEEIIKNAIISDIVEHTIKLASKYTSSVKNTIIYFDGIPSVSKIKEQLRRRCGQSILKILNNNILNNNILNNNILKTTSMIEEHVIREKLLNNFPSIDLNSPLVNTTRDLLKEKGFTINDTNRYGEAEHQMMTDLRDVKYKDKYILIASPDADLILLSMIIYVFNNVKIDIYRESILSPSHFDFSWEYKKNKLSNIISPYMRETYFINVGNLMTNMGLNTKQQILDISYLMLLLGDDFIPIISTLNAMAIDTIIKIYMTHNLFIINMHIPITINIANLIKFIKLLSHDEINLTENKKKKFNLKIKEKKKNIDKSYLQYLIFMNSDDNIVIKKLYYLDNGIIINNDGSEKLIMTEFQDPVKVNDTILKNYIEGYQFIFNLYYLNTITNYKWYYQYDRAPTLTEIVKYLDTKTQTELTHIFDYTNGIITAKDLNYFDTTTYKKYIDDNKNKIFNNIITNILRGNGLPSISFDKSLLQSNIDKYITYDNIKYIYKCFNALYLQSCLDYDETLIDPYIPEYNIQIRYNMLGGSDIYYLKYRKYKTKYHTLIKK